MAMASSKEWQKMVRGELYWAWDADLQANRERCKEACKKFNEAGAVSRRKRVELWREYVFKEVIHAHPHMLTFGVV